METKFVLITGTSSGMGEATAQLLSRQGYTVFAGVRNEKAFQQWKERANKAIIPLKLDVTRPNDIEAALPVVQEITGTHGLFALINNAGNNYCTPTELYDDRSARNLMETHFWGMAHLTKTFIPLLRQYSTQHPEGARIINVGSVGSVSAFPFIQFYNAAKFAMLGFSESLRFELRPQNIRVSAVLPGAVKTEIWRRTEETIDAAVNNLSGDFLTLYKSNLIAATRLSASLEQNGVTSENAARIFQHVLETSRPRLKYFIGTDAKALNFMAKYLPDSVRHRIVDSQLRFT